MMPTILFDDATHQQEGKHYAILADVVFCCLLLSYQSIDSPVRESTHFLRSQLVYIPTMKLSSAALLALLWTAAAAPGATAFVGPRLVTKTPTTSSMDKTTPHSPTTLYNGMMGDYLSSLSDSPVGGPPMTPHAAATGSAAVTPNAHKLGQRWRKKTKQLATLGPASCSFEMIEKLFLAGADVFRLNFSHGEHAQKKELLDVIRAVEAKYDHPIAVLGDLQGPKLRVGTFGNPDGESLTVGQSFTLDLDPSPGTASRVLLPHPEIIEASEVGHVLLIDDGKVKLVVTATGPGYLECRVEVGGKIKDKKVRLRMCCSDAFLFALGKFAYCQIPYLVYSQSALPDSLLVFRP
jgi:hypothetical protein